MTRWTFALLLSLGFHAILAIGTALLLTTRDQERVLPVLDLTKVDLILSEREDANALAQTASSAPAEPSLPSAPPLPPPPVPYSHEISPRQTEVPPFTPNKPIERPQMTTPRSPERRATSQAKIDAQPKPMQMIRPAYPHGARKRGEQGRVVVEIKVSRTGTVTSVRVATSSGFPDLDQAALQAVEKAKFSPAQQEGTAVEATVLLPMDFKLK